ncbi:MAG: 50S ribosomal protein L24 [Candidatus Omnitrophica bacterium]|nr:50S ribosomal protein L24 [Candidatus Omnitrophota bacterium]
MARLRKGDTVAVLTGKDRGKRGKIVRIIPDAGQAFVERINLVKHFDRRTSADQPGGVIEREAPLALDKLALVCPRCNKPTRIGWKRGADGAKQRICKQCLEVAGG